MKYAVGLDIGTTKVVVIVGRQNEYGKFEVLSMGDVPSSGVERGEVRNIVETQKAITKAVDKVEAELGKKITRAMVGIAGRHIRSAKHMEYINRPEPESLITQKDIEELGAQAQLVMMPPGEKIIDYLAQEYKVDSSGNIKNPVGMIGQRLETNFHLIISNEEAMEHIRRSVSEAGLGLDSLILEPIASAKSVLSEEEKEAGVAVIDLGGGTSDLVIYKNGKIRHTAVVPVGGNTITKDIAYGLKINPTYAEELKLKFGSAFPGEITQDEVIQLETARGEVLGADITLKGLARIINSRLTEIIDFVDKEIEQYKRNNPKDELNEGIVITGGGANLRHIKEATEFITGMSVRIGIPNEHLGGLNAKEIKNPKYATAVGLLMESVLKSKGDNLEGVEEQETEQEGVLEEEEGTLEAPKEKEGFWEKLRKWTFNILVLDPDEKTKW